jgi:hypothetical protein
VSSSKIFGVEILGSLLGSYDHCFVMMNVTDHFESRFLYVHSPNHPHRIKFLKSALIYGGSRIIRQDTRSSDALPCFSLSTVGSSGPTPDDPAVSSGSPLPPTGSSGYSPDDPAYPLCHPSDHPALHRMIRPWHFTYINPTVWNPRFTPHLLRRPLFCPNFCLVIFRANEDFFVPSCALLFPHRKIRHYSGTSFQISPRSLNVGCLRRFPPVNHLLYPYRGHA